MSGLEHAYERRKRRARGAGDRDWNALRDPSDKHPAKPHSASCAKRVEDATQEAEQTNKTLQLSQDYIHVSDSCDIDISSTGTQAAVNVQAGLQAAILVIIAIAIGDDADPEEFVQQLTQTVKTKQITHQETVIENSKNVSVDRTDLQAHVNIQLLLQLLVAIAVVLDIL
ncbi:spore coat protein [Salsuginibacillus kocurii]|uniref:spore coat protein n=1 Tax=Salsuginibacillus kocurii TaxID=427078 RepID=UPI00037F0B63|nr:spore coat protein [Salsuginibacillus kocurii]